ncbi:MAG: porin, partial [Rhodobacter sp.]|nr:porin [Rhodobacter sp.]
DARFSSRVRVKFALAAELDNGLSAGGDIRADNAPGGASGTAGKVFLSGSFGTLAMGDVDPAAKAALGHPSAVGYTEVGSMNEITYTRGSTPEEPALLYTLPKMGPVQAYASVGQETTTTGTGDDAVSSQEISFDTLSVGAKADLAFGDMGTAWIGAGFEGATDGGDEHVLVGVGASVSGFTGKLVAGMQDDSDQFGVSAGYSAGVIGATVFYTDDTDMDGNEALGVGLSWSLGGGASIVGGVATDIGQGENEDVRHADLGVTFSF